MRSPPLAEGCSGIAGTRVRKKATTARPGSARSGVHVSPKRSANGAKISGPNEKPSVPPVMYTDIASPGRSPPSRWARAAAGG